MSASIDILNPDTPKQVLMIVANAAVSEQTGWPLGFWWAELTHPYWEFIERGYKVDIVSPEGGTLQADSWSDPRDESGYSAHDLLSLGFIHSAQHAGLVANTPSLAAVSPDAYDAIFLVGWLGRTAGVLLLLAIIEPGAYSWLRIWKSSR